MDGMVIVVEKGPLPTIAPLDCVMRQTENEKPCLSGRAPSCSSLPVLLILVLSPEFFKAA
jgi:hypothetical protein